MIAILMRRLVFTLALTALAVPAGSVRAQECREVVVAFQPDCFRPSLGAPCDPPKANKRLDFGPQIAIWITDATGAFVDTVMVTNLTARFGIGNRPGRWDFGSGPMFPYGKRRNVLPVWAHARGRLYPELFMQDDEEGILGFHESVSSPDPYFCRPLDLDQIVDAVTCPTASFGSAKGRFDPVGMDAMGRPFPPQRMTIYPPRNDLTSFTAQDCDQPPGSRPGGKCASTSAEKFAGMNDLDVVAAATPPYGAVHSVRWRLPVGLQAGRYTVNVEVSKEFDQNARHTYPADGKVGFTWMPLDVTNNIGQPSVVFQTPIAIGTAEVGAAQVTTPAGYGDWNGQTGTLHPPDETISASPGSGIGRLLAIPSPWKSAPPQAPGRVHVSSGACLGPDDSDPCLQSPAMPLPPTEMVALAPDAVSASLGFKHGGMPDGSAVLGYEIRYRQGNSMADADFLNAIPIQPLPAGPPGSSVTTTIPGLKQLTWYVVGVRAIGPCGTQSPLAVAAFETLQMRFTTLSGCFIATAAHGSPQAPELAGLRWFRDTFLRRTDTGRTAVDLYYRASPPLADVVAGDDTLRAALRRALAPVVEVAAAARILSGAHP